MVVVRNIFSFGIDWFTRRNRVGNRFGFYRKIPPNFCFSIWNSDRPTRSPSLRRTISVWALSVRSFPFTWIRMRINRWIISTCRIKPLRSDLSHRRICNYLIRDRIFTSPGIIPFRRIILLKFSTMFYNGVQRHCSTISTLNNPLWFAIQHGFIRWEASNNRNTRFNSLPIPPRERTVNPSNRKSPSVRTVVFFPVLFALWLLHSFRTLFALRLLWFHFASHFDFMLFNRFNHQCLMPSCFSDHSMLLPSTIVLDRFGCW